MIVWASAAWAVESGPSPGPPPGEYGSIAVELRASYYAVDKTGVPDAARVGLAVHARRVWTPGPFAVGLGIPIVYGHSESAGHSYRLGIQSDVALPIATKRVAPYMSLGGHYFVSQGWDEVRFGPMWRVALGLRLFGEGPWEFGIEPLAVERIPDGPGPHTPLRSRWGWDVTFLTLGVTG